MVERLFLALPRGCLQFAIVVFPDHTHLLFSMNGDTYSVLTFLFYEIPFIAYAYSHGAEADSEGFASLPLLNIL